MDRLHTDDGNAKPEAPVSRIILWLSLHCEGGSVCVDTTDEDDDAGVTVMVMVTMLLVVVI